MEKFNLELNKKDPVIDPSEFNPIKRIRTKSGVTIIGAATRLNGIFVLIEEENGEMTVKPLREVVSAVDPAWAQIEKNTKKSNPRLANIRPRGNYSKLAKQK